jgi:transcriptional regulator with XRE-family HTH domain
MNVGDAIKNLRKNKGLSQKDLAQKCGLSANAMCSIEKNEAFPSRDSIDRICKALEIPTSYLMFFSVTDEDIPAEKRVAFNAMKAILMG